MIELSCINNAKEIESTTEIPKNLKIQKMIKQI